eukprot:2633593-Amphidinium_carterae.1
MTSALPTINKTCLKGGAQDDRQRLETTANMIQIHRLPLEVHLSEMASLPGISAAGSTIQAKPVWRTHSGSLPRVTKGGLSHIKAVHPDFAMCMNTSQPLAHVLLCPGNLHTCLVETLKLVKFEAKKRNSGHFSLCGVQQGPGALRDILAVQILSSPLPAHMPDQRSHCLQPPHIMKLTVSKHHHQQNWMQGKPWNTEPTCFQALRCSVPSTKHVMVTDVADDTEHVRTACGHVESSSNSWDNDFTDPKQNYKCDWEATQSPAIERS